MSPIADLENQLVSRSDRVMIVAGTGVSMAACPNNPCVSWKGLLENGLNHCLVCGTASSRVESQRQILHGSDATANDYIGVATFVTTELTDQREGVYANWLNSTIGQMHPTDVCLVNALHSLGCKLATTNYDHLLEAGGLGQPITWLDRGLATEFLRSPNPSQDVLHLHGSYRRPESVVLGHRSYDDVYRDPALQTLLHSVMTLGTLLFVGCGAGLEDLNFGTLLNWSREALSHCYHNHYILVRESEVQQWRERLQGILIIPIAYGASYSDLAPFLESLASRVNGRRTSNPQSGLSSAQVSFDAEAATLQREREQLPVVTYLERQLSITIALRDAGGIHQAALTFSGAVNSQSTSLTPQDQMRFALVAAEMLLDDHLPDMAVNHVQDAVSVITPYTSREMLTRLRQLEVRCYRDLCYYHQLLESIERELPHVSGDTRDRLEAIRDETRWLQGEYDSVQQSEGTS